MPLTDAVTTSGSDEDSGYFQCAIFITEWIRSPELWEALLISSAAPGSSVVGHSICSKPQSTASLNRSGRLIDFGSMLSSTAFLMGSRADAAASAAVEAETNVRRVIKELSAFSDQLSAQTVAGFRFSVVGKIPCHLNPPTTDNRQLTTDAAESF